MLLIIEIMLTISAWKKGWKGAALLPLVIGMFIAFVFGSAMADTGVDDMSVIIFGVLIDIGIIISLAVMSAREPHRESAGHEDVVLKKNEEPTCVSQN